MRMPPVRGGSQAYGRNNLTLLAHNGKVTAAISADRTHVKSSYGLGNYKTQAEYITPRVGIAAFAEDHDANVVLHPAPKTTTTRWCPPASEKAEEDDHIHPAPE
jgi:hypothetical protein